MRFFQTIKLALKNIKSNKMRSALTMIGIIIGVSSVIIMVALGSGSSSNIKKQVQSLGTNLISVSIMSNGSNKVTMSTLDEIKKLEGVKDLTPSISASATVKAGEESQETSLTGTTSNFITIRGLTLANGRFICDIDVENRNKVVILGSTIATELYGLANPVGQELQVNGNTYIVEGVLKAQGSSMGSNIDDMVIAPVTTVMSLAKSNSISSIYIEAANESAVDTAKSSMDSYLTKLLKSTSTRKAYTIMTQKQLLDTMDSITQTLSLLLGGIAGISLIVGGIGVMNVMLVSVSERTKEIGIRKAMGGKRKDIMTQFLIEALVLSSIGGIIGVALGLGGGWLMSKLGMNIAFSMTVMLLAFSFSMLVGVVFGIFPAYKASKLKPIDALRYE